MVALLLRQLSCTAGSQYGDKESFRIAFDLSERVPLFNQLPGKPGMCFNDVLEDKKKDGDLEVNHSS